MDLLQILGAFALMFAAGLACGYWLRGPRVVILRPSTAQWALLASLSSSQRTIARLKMHLTRAEEANHDLRERLEAAQRNLSQP